MYVCMYVCKYVHLFIYIQNIKTANATISKIINNVIEHCAAAVEAVMIGSLLDRCR